MSHPTFSRPAVCYLAFGFTLLLGVIPARAQTLYVTNTTNISTSQSYSNGFIGSSNALTSLTGNLTVNSGAMLTVTNALTLGNVTNTPNNRVTISGAGSEFSAGGVTVGSGSAGNSLLVTNGAILRTDLSNASLVSVSVGSGTFASNNILTVTGSGSGWVQTNTNRAVFVGDSGDNNQLVFSGGSVSSIASSINVGSQASAAGNSLQVTGAGTILTNRSIILANGTNQSLVISGGAQVVSTATGSAQLNPSLSLANTFGATPQGHSALITDSGTTYTMAGGLNVGFQGTASLVISNGAQVFNTATTLGNSYIGYISNASGSSVLVTGAGSVWSNASTLSVGSSANTNSSLTVRDGALVSIVRGLDIGEITNTVGASVTVDNATLSLAGGTSDGFLMVGRRGSQSRLLVTNGGDVTVSNGITIGQGASETVGAHSNVALVTGAGSSIFQAALTGSFGNRIGSLGRDNSLIVSNGATVVMGGASSFQPNQIGFGTNSSGNSIVVTGAGSVWGGRADLDVGFSGSSNFVSVRDAGLVTNGTVRIGASNSANANYLLVDGAGSVFSNRISLTVGNGTNTGNRVTVTNGGVLHAGNTLDIRSNSTVTAAGSVWVGRDRTSAQAINVLNSGVTSTSTLTVNGTLTAQGNVTIGNLGLLGGAGTITASNTTIASGGRLSPGNSPGTITVDGNMTWLGGGNYNWQIHNATGLVGTGWDYMSVTGALDLTALTPSSKFNINLWSLSAVSPDANGAAINFDNTLDGQSWDILVAVGGITGFDAADFNINIGATNGTGGFANALAPGGFFGLQQQGNVISLTYTVPEPSTYALLALAAGAAGYVRWRKRKKVS